MSAFGATLSRAVCATVAACAISGTDGRAVAISAPVGGFVQPSRSTQLAIVCFASGDQFRSSCRDNLLGELAVRLPSYGGGNTYTNREHVVGEASRRWPGAGRIIDDWLADGKLRLCGARCCGHSHIPFHLSCMRKQPYPFCRAGLTSCPSPFDRSKTEGAEPGGLFTTAVNKGLRVMQPLYYVVDQDLCCVTAKKPPPCRFGSKADLPQRNRDVRFTPKADIH